MILGAIVIVTLGFIVVNYFKSLDDGATLPGTAVEDSQPTVKRGEGSVTYVVGGGESLWEIAEKQYGSGYNWVDIASENSIANPNVIEKGQELTIPDVAAKELTTVVEKEAISGGTYTVSKGDTLWNIAVRAYGDGYQWLNIASENSLANPSLIHEGNVLTLPR